LYSDSNSLRDTLVFQFRSIKWNYIAGSGDAFVRITQQNCLYPLHLDICPGSSFVPALLLSRLFFCQGSSFVKALLFKPLLFSTPSFTSAVNTVYASFHDH